MKCALCGKPITNVNRLDGKNYGSSCFKLVKAMKFAMLQQEQNLEYNRKCIALLSVFKEKSFKDSWNSDFKNSVIEQWENYGKLSYKQFDLISKKLDDNENIAYQYAFITQLEDEEQIKRLHKELFNRNKSYDQLNVIKKYQQFEVTLKYVFERSSGYFWSYEQYEGIEKQMPLSLKNLEEDSKDDEIIITKIVKF